MDNNELIKYFKSINFYPKFSEDKTDFLPSTTSIIDWLNRFHTYYQNKLDIVNGNNFHTLYNREVAVHGVEILNCIDKIKEISLFSKSLGYGYSITLDIKEIKLNFEKIESLVKDEVITSLGIIIEEDDEKVTKFCPSHEYADLLTKISNLKISIGLIANIETLYELGILNLPNFNSLTFTIYPLNGSQNEHFNDDSVTSCSRHLRILINEDGLIYSCLGLFGLEDFSIGSIYTPLEDTLFETGNSKLDFKKLIENGPTLNINRLNERKRMTGLPQMCELHRISLTEG